MLEIFLAGGVLMKFEKFLEKRGDNCLSAELLHCFFMGKTV
ncbi:hypothetical protein HMPREF1992_00905 [Selenomonas sp. oral taxon 892 str. F0426]|nr:hypothetical protein HMPREF1992_00905 [Selenomonas sp. oral taxon 892 str. F0426]